MSPGGMQHLLEGMKMFWFIPKALAGFGPTVLHEGTASLPVMGKAAERENPKEKPKGHSSTLLGPSPACSSPYGSAGCSPELLRDHDGAHEDSGFWLAALWSVAQGRADPALLRERNTRLPGQQD